MSNATDPYIDPDSSIEIDYSNEEALLDAAETVDRSPSPPSMTRSLGMDLKNMVTLIETIPLKDGRFFKSEAGLQKKQIYIHHTAGWGDPVGNLHGWNDANNQVGTWCLIAGRRIHRRHKHTDGHVYRAFSSKDWAWHLGVSTSNSRQLNKESIGIELCSFGPLRKISDNEFAPLNPQVSARFTTDQVTVYDASNGYPDGYRGHHYHEKYTEAQLEALENVLSYLCSTYNIPMDYKGDQMFDVDQRALDGEPGIWSHTSVRGLNKHNKYEKYDCHPQPELISMLKGLSPLA